MPTKGLLVRKKNNNKRFIGVQMNITAFSSVCMFIFYSHKYTQDRFFTEKRS